MHKLTRYCPSAHMRNSAEQLDSKGTTLLRSGCCTRLLLGAIRTRVASLGLRAVGSALACLVRGVRCALNTPESAVLAFAHDVVVELLGECGGAEDNEENGDKVGELHIDGGDFPFWVALKCFQKTLSWITVRVL